MNCARHCPYPLPLPPTPRPPIPPPLTVTSIRGTQGHRHPLLVRTSQTAHRQPSGPDIAHGSPAAFWSGHRIIVVCSCSVQAYAFPCLTRVDMLSTCGSSTGARRHLLARTASQHRLRRLQWQLHGNFMAIDALVPRRPAATAAATTCRHLGSLLPSRQGLRPGTASGRCADPERQWLPRIEGSMNAYGSEGPSHGRAKARRPAAGRATASVAADADDQLLAQAIDPDWQPRQAIPTSERYLLLHMPTGFRDAMLADSAAWAQGADRPVCRAIANAIAGCVMPKLADLEGWVEHATQFFMRLCAHRRSRGATVDAAVAQLQQRVLACENAIAELRASAAAAEQLTAVEALRGSQRAAEAVRELRMGRSQSPRGRGREVQAAQLAVDARIMLGQVTAAQARSASPAASTHAAIGEFLARRAAAEAPVGTEPPDGAP